MTFPPRSNLPQFGAPPLSPMVLRIGAVLLAVHVAFAVGVKVIGLWIMYWLYHVIFALSSPGIETGFVWQVLTYAVLHSLDDPMHLVFNLLGLYFLGAPLEQRWGGAALLRFAVFCAVGGGVATAIGALVLPGVFGSVTVGASAAVFGLLGAWAWLNPDATILLAFVIPIRARYIVPISVGLDVLAYISGSPLAILAHLGGLGTAWLLVTGRIDPTKWFKRKRPATAASGRATRLRVIPGGRRDGDADLVN